MKILTQPIEIDREKIDSRYRFVIAAAIRAKQLNEGAMPTKKTRVKKETTLALEEVLNGTVRVLSGETAVRAREAAEKNSRENMIDEAGQKKTHVEDLTELEKDMKGCLQKRRNSEEEFFPWDVFRD